MKVKIKKLRENAQSPKYQTPDSAAADLHACLDSPLTVLPGERVKVPTGIAIEYEDKNVVAVICARPRTDAGIDTSGLSAKHGIALANGIGVVDPDYRGELLVSVVNLSDTPYTFIDGERIAQLLLLPIIRGEFEIADTLSDTERGSGGFGSTGA